MGKATGDASGVVIIHFDVKLSGESITAPRLRIAPFQERVYSQMVGCILEARNQSASSTPGLNVGDAVVLVDGGRPGNLKAMKKPWLPEAQDGGDDDAVVVAGEEDAADGAEAGDGTTPKVITTSMHLFMDEASLRLRRKLTRGTMSLRQVEGMHVMTHGCLSLPERPGKHYPGTNRGTVLGPIVFTSVENDWQLTVKQKREVYTRRFRIAVGGRNPGGEADPRKDSDVEPVFHWSFPAPFYEDLYRASQ